MKIAYIIIICFFALQTDCLAQHVERKISIEKLSASNSKLDSIINDFVDQEKKCSYYSCELIFTIGVNRIGFDSDQYSILIESLEDRNIALGLEPKGYFKDRGHFFLIDGDSYQHFFTGSLNFKEFEYLKYDPTYQEPGSDEIVINVFTDDSYSQQEWKFGDDIFVLLNSYNSCEEKRE